MKRILVLGMLLALVLTAIGAPVSAKNYSEWSTPVSLGPVVNSAAQDSCQAITKDGLSLYFASNRPGGYGLMDLYVTCRGSTDQPWGTPQNLGPVINTGFNERCIYVTPDDRALIFVSDGRPDGKGSGDFSISYRHDKKDPLGWGPPANITELNNSSNVWAMTGFEEDTGSLKLYFGSDAAGGVDIYSTTMAENGEFSPPALVPELNSPYVENMQVVRKDGLEMFITSNRPGGFGGTDIWVSTRERTSDPWSPPVNMGPVVNTAASEGRAVISWDGTTIIFYSNRAGTLGSFDLWTTTRGKVTGANK